MNVFFKLVQLLKDQNNNVSLTVWNRQYVSKTVYPYSQKKCGPDHLQMWFWWMSCPEDLRKRVKGHLCEPEQLSVIYKVELRPLPTHLNHSHLNPCERKTDVKVGFSHQGWIPGTLHQSGTNVFKHSNHWHSNISTDIAQCLPTLHPVVRNQAHPHSPI